MWSLLQSVRADTSGGCSGWRFALHGACSRSPETAAVTALSISESEASSVLLPTPNCAAQQQAPQPGVAVGSWRLLMIVDGGQAAAVSHLLSCKLAGALPHRAVLWLLQAAHTGGACIGITVTLSDLRFLLNAQLGSHQGLHLTPAAPAAATITLSVLLLIAGEVCQVRRNSDVYFFHSRRQTAGIPN